MRHALKHSRIKAQASGSCRRTPLTVLSRRWFLLSVGILLIPPVYCVVVELAPDESSSSPTAPILQCPPGAQFAPPDSLFVDDVGALQHDLTRFAEIRRVSVVTQCLTRADVRHLASLPCLTELSFFRAQIDGEVLAGLTDLPSLKRLFLNYATCPPSDWTELYRAVLKYPVQNRCRVVIAEHDRTRQDGPAMLSLRDLSLLSLVGSDIPEQVLADVTSALPDCEVLFKPRPNGTGGSAFPVPHENQNLRVQNSAETYPQPATTALCPLPGEAREFAASISPRFLNDSAAPASPFNSGNEEFVELCRAVERTIYKAAAFYRRRALAGGGYVRELPAGLEGPPTTGKIVLRPPGTADVGQAYLAAYRSTGHPSLLDASLATARALAETQLSTCGWNSAAELDPIRRRAYGYRGDPEATGFHATYLDYLTTRTTLEFLMALDEATKFEHSDIHQAAVYCLEKLLIHQYPNGAWPQWIKQTLPVPDDYPLKRASFPATWSRIRSTQGYAHYRYHYTINDNTITNLIYLMLQAAETYRDQRFRDAALRAGDFLLLAQLPEPQPAWAQQYNSDMHPSWGRSFEPPAITGRGSQRVIDTLLDLYNIARRRKYIDAARKAIAYLERSTLPDGKLARFYELKTNRPLYVTRRYMLTYSDRDLIRHYSMKAGNALPLLRQYCEDLGQGVAMADVEPAPPDEKEVERIVAGLDHRGAWVEHDAGSGQAIIRLVTFVQNMHALSQFLAARPESEHAATQRAHPGS